MQIFVINESEKATLLYWQIKYFHRHEKSAAYEMEMLEFVLNEVK